MQATRHCRKASSRWRSTSSAPAELARRLNQIGVIDKADGARLAALLKPGQRLVSAEGDLWRWDGFAAAAHAPTGAARRLAERARLAEIDAEQQIARSEAETARGVVVAGRSQPASRGRRRNAGALRRARASTRGDDRTRSA